MATLIKTLPELKNYLNSLKNQNKTIGLVPTMGALHDGHLSLIKESKKQTDFTVVTIFVNPSQFGPNEDFENYPRTLKSDLNKLKEIGADAVFTPDTKAIYPDPSTSSTKVTVTPLSKLFCGKSRPQFFDGVCLVVSKLFNLTKPNKAFFGEKDFQQTIIIKKMVQDLMMDIDIITCPIIREKNGLAKSSRNQYLSTEDTQIACNIFKALSKAKEAFKSGNTDKKKLQKIIAHHLETHAAPLTIDYIDIVDAKTCLPKESPKKDDRILFAGYLHQTRLIDNLAL